MNNNTVVLTYSKHDLFVNQIALYAVADGLTGEGSTCFLAYVVEINPLFLTNDDLDLNFIFALIFEEIITGLN